MFFIASLLVPAGGLLLPRFTKEYVPGGKNRTPAAIPWESQKKVPDFL
jgi:hypothetical protein